MFLLTFSSQSQNSSIPQLEMSIWNRHDSRCGDSLGRTRLVCRGRTGLRRSNWLRHDRGEISTRQIHAGHFFDLSRAEIQGYRFGSAQMLCGRWSSGENSKLFWVARFKWLWLAGSRALLIGRLVARTQTWKSLEVPTFSQCSVVNSEWGRCYSWLRVQLMVRLMTQWFNWVNGSLNHSLNSVTGSLNFNGSVNGSVFSIATLKIAPGWR